MILHHEHGYVFIGDVYEPPPLPPKPRRWPRIALCLTAIIIACLSLWALSN